MRELILMRHAHAAGEGDDDLARALTSDGEDEARNAGRWLAERGVQPQLVLCSPAARARRTAELALAELPDHDCELRTSDAAYAATPGELIALLDAHPDVSPLLLVGHNPGIERLLALLVSGTSSAYRGVPPATVACLHVAGALEPGAAELTAFHCPS